MALDYRAHDPQSKPQPGSVGFRILPAPKTLKERQRIAWRRTGSFILHPDFYLRLVALRADADRCPGGRKLCGVSQKIDEHLLKPLGIARDRPATERFQLNAHLQVGLSEQRPQEFSSFARQ